MLNFVGHRAHKRLQCRLVFCTTLFILFLTYLLSIMSVLRFDSLSFTQNWNSFGFVIHFLFIIVCNYTKFNAILKYWFMARDHQGVQGKQPPEFWIFPSTPPRIFWQSLTLQVYPHPVFFRKIGHFPPFSVIQQFKLV